MLRGQEDCANHLALNYFAARQALALPMVVCEGGSGGSYGTEMTFNGLMVYRVTLAGGFRYLGGISHATAGQDPYGGQCHNWWTRSNSLVKRSIFMDDYVYSVAPDLIRVADIADLSHPLASVGLTSTN